MGSYGGINPGAAWLPGASLALKPQLLQRAQVSLGGIKSQLRAGGHMVRGLGLCPST